MQRPDGLNERQILAAQAQQRLFMAGCCTSAKCSVETIRAWRKQTDFNETIWLYQQEIFQQSFGVTSEALPMAIAKLREIVGGDDHDVSVGVKVQAIKILIDSAQEAIRDENNQRRVNNKVMRMKRLLSAKPIRRLHQENTGGGEAMLENRAIFTPALTATSGRSCAADTDQDVGHVKPF